MADTSYDAFISYAHAADGALAPAIQGSLTRFAKPWWRRRALRVFRDETGLSANPHLWKSIEEALDSSRWLVLLLSPEAAHSEWVDQELRHWLTTKSAARVLPVLTQGELVWRADGSLDMAASSAAPPSLAHAFDGEPRWVDLRWARTADSVDLASPRFRAAVADVAAPIHGLSKEDLDSEEVRQHRRTRRTAWTAGIALVALTLSSVAAGALAVRQRTVADERAAVIDSQAHDAQALQLGTVSQTVRDRDLGLLLAAAGYTMHRTSATASNLVATLEHFDHRLFDVSVGAQVRSMAVEADGTHIDMQDHTGSPFVWSTTAQARTGSLTPGGSCCDALALKGDGTLAVVSAQPNRSDARLWVAPAGEGEKRWKQLPGSVVTCLFELCAPVVWGDDRLLVRPVGPGGTVDGDRLGLVDPSGSRPPVTRRFSDQITFFGAGTTSVLAVTESRASSTRRTLHWLDPTRLTQRRSLDAGPLERFAVSRDGRTFAAASDLGIWIGPSTATPLNDPADPHMAWLPFQDEALPRVMEFSPDGSRLAAVSAAGALRVIRVSDHRVVDAEDATNPSALAWSPDSTRLYVAGFDGHVLGFDVDPGHSMQTILGGRLPGALGASSSAFTADGVAAVGGWLGPFGVGFAGLGRLAPDSTDADEHRLPDVHAYPDLRVAALPETGHALVVGGGGATVSDWDVRTLRSMATVATPPPPGFDPRTRTPDGIDPDIPFQDVMHPLSPDISSVLVSPDGTRAWYLMAASGQQVLRSVATNPLGALPDLVVSASVGTADIGDDGRAWEPIGWATTPSDGATMVVVCGLHCVGRLDVTTATLVSAVDTGSPIDSGDDRLTAGATDTASSTIAVGTSTGGLRFFDADDLSARTPWQQAAPATVTATAFLVDSSTTAASSPSPVSRIGTPVLTVAAADSTVSFWTPDGGADLDGGRLGNPLDLMAQPGAVLPTATGVVLVGSDGTASEVPVGEEAWLELACRTAGRTLTADEVARYLPSSDGPELGATVCAG